MAIEIFIPRVGANIEEIEVGKIYFKKGAQVKKGDILFEIITDKANFEVEGLVIVRSMFTPCFFNLRSF